MLIIHDYPGDVAVSRYKVFSSLGHLNLEFVSLSTCGTLVYSIPVQSISLGTFLSCDDPIVWSALQTNDKWKSLGVKVVFFDCTCLDQITLALSLSMLACKAPVWSVLKPSGISIGEKPEVANLPKVLSLSIIKLL